MRVSELTKILFLEDLRASNFRFEFDMDDQIAVLHSKKLENCYEYHIELGFEYDVDEDEDYGDYDTPAYNTIDAKAEIIDIRFFDNDGEEVAIKVGVETLNELKQQATYQIEDYIEETH